MSSPLVGCTEQRRTDAVAELVAELGEFSYDGLLQLERDLAEGRVLRGSWAGCVMSYRRGAPGSTRRDRLGRARNTFTELWDSGWLTDREVAVAVGRELALRRPAAIPAGPGPADTESTCPTSSPPSSR